MPADLAALAALAAAVGENPALAQGGGGNASVKVGETMYIKASGTRLSDLSAQNGFVGLAYLTLKNFFDQSSEDLTESLSNNAIAKHITERLGSPTLRPSIETGFHLYLKSFVLHTHSVYANTILCTTQAKELLKQFFDDVPFTRTFVPFFTPGLFLTRAIAAAVRTASSFPEVLFLENHGIIYTSDNLDRIKSLQQMVEESLQKVINFPPFPEPKLVKGSSDNEWHSASPWWKTFLSAHKNKLERLTEFVLFPDCAVYGSSAKEKVAITKEGIHYQTTLAEAQATEETLLAWSYVVTIIEQNKWTLQPIPLVAVKHILGMDVEKYRQSLLKK